MNKSEAYQEAYRKELRAEFKVTTTPDDTMTLNQFTKMDDTEISKCILDDTIKNHKADNEQYMDTAPKPDGRVKKRNRIIMSF